LTVCAPLPCSFEVDAAGLLSMNKADLVRRIASRSRSTLGDAESVVNAIFDEITAALARGERVEIRGFGAFTVRKWAARTGRNPSTGALVAVAPNGRPHFKPAKEAGGRLNRTPV
jgi:integration host factor subunit beta